MQVLQLGAVYVVVGLGFSLVWRSLRILNLAHGGLVMVGAYVSFYVSQRWHIDALATIPIAMLAMFCLAWLLYLALVRPVLGAPLLVTLLLTAGLELVIVDVALNAFTTSARSGASSSWPAMAVALLLAGALWLLADRTSLQELPGLSFALAGATAGAAGSLILGSSAIDPAAGLFYTLTAFAVCALGGLGNVAGVVAGGLVLAAAQTRVGPDWFNAVAFGLLMVLLIFRPAGIFGQAVA